jgi:hypothetical protein
MTDDPVPWIEEQDYEKIRELVPELPKRHSDWLAMYEQDAGQRRLLGHEPSPIRIVPQELVDFLRQHGRRGSVQELVRLAVHMAKTPASVVDEFGSFASDDDFDPLQSDD